MNQVTSFRTVTGQEVFFEDPERTKFNFKDALDQLGRICRYNGVIKISVLDHLLICVVIAGTEGVSPAIVAYVAAHDLHEYVLGDVPTGLKECLPDYRQLERRWEAHVHEQLGLVYPLPSWLGAVVKTVDRRALVAEMSVCAHPSWEEVESLYGVMNEVELAAVMRIVMMVDNTKTNLLHNALYPASLELGSTEEGLGLLQRLQRLHEPPVVH